MRLFIGFLATVVVAMGQGVGAKYGSREPATCPSKKDPAKGSPSAEQARRYFLCNAEGVTGGTLYLLEDVKLEIGKGTPFKELAFGNRPGTADTDGLVYQIRGSLKKYQCEVQNTTGMFVNVGKNCRIYDEPKATGSCFKDNFGEWQCSMMDLGAPQRYGTAGQPPPK